MLKFFREKKFQKLLMGSLAVITVLGFVLSGVLIGEDDKKTSGSLAKFEKRTISVQEYLDSYRAVQRQASMMYGEKLSEVRDRINFKSEAWDRLLLLEYAKKRQIRATDSEVVDWITKQTGFQKDGKFDDTFYQMYIERGLRSTPRQFEEETRQMLTISKVQDRLRQELKLTDDKLKELYKEERAEKDLVYGLVTFESLASQAPAVGDEDVQKLYDLVKDRLTDPATGKPLTLDEAKEEVKKKVSEGKLSELALQKMNAARAKIKSPADFEAVLQAEGITVDKIEKYTKGTYPAGIYPSENLQRAVEKLKEGEVSEVFGTPKGAMIVKVTAVRAADDKKFDEEKKSFQERVESEKGREGLEKALDEMRGKLSLNVDLMKELFPAD